MARADVPRCSGPKIGKYCVIVDEAINVGVTALEYALNNCSLIVIDEVGPMELSIPKLKSTIEKVLKSDKDVIAVIHRNLITNVISELCHNQECKVYEVNERNREYLHLEIVKNFI